MGASSLPYEPRCLISILLVKDKKWESNFKKLSTSLWRTSCMANQMMLFDLALVEA